MLARRTLAPRIGITALLWFCTATAYPQDAPPPASPPPTPPPAAAPAPPTPPTPRAARGPAVPDFGPAYRYEAVVMEVSGTLEQLMSLDADQIAQQTKTSAGLTAALKGGGESTLRLRVDQCVRQGGMLQASVVGAVNPSSASVPSAAGAPQNTVPTPSRRTELTCEMKFEMHRAFRTDWLDGFLELECDTSQEAAYGAMPYVTRQRMRHAVSARSGAPICSITINGNGGSNGQPVGIVTWIRLTALD